MGRPLTSGRDAGCLLGSRCGACATVAFPPAGACQRCGATAMDPLELGRTGTVWAFTVQRFAPKSPPYVPPPEGFAPFVVGYVELPEGIKVEALLDCADLGDLAADAEVSLVATEPVPRFATAGAPAGSASAPAASPPTRTENPPTRTEGPASAGSPSEGAS